jgi:hypothetical protein
MTETHTPLPCPWKVGDKVQRKPGASYLFPGVVISVGLKLDGKTWHCEVECIAPGVEGCTHVFPASQLVPLDPAWNTRADSHHRLVKALEAIRDRAIKLRKGTDDWFELVEIEAAATAALKEAGR